MEMGKLNASMKGTVIPGDGMKPIHRQDGQSVANFWGQCLAAAARGEDIELANKHGEVVAMMVSLERYNQLKARADLPD